MEGDDAPMEEIAGRTKLKGNKLEVDLGDLPPLTQQQIKDKLKDIRVMFVSPSSSTVFPSLRDLLMNEQGQDQQGGGTQSEGGRAEEKMQTAENQVDPTSETVEVGKNDKDDAEPELVPRVASVEEVGPEVQIQSQSAEEMVSGEEAPQQDESVDAQDESVDTKEESVETKDESMDTEIKEVVPVHDELKTAGEELQSKPEPSQSEGIENDSTEGPASEEINKEEHEGPAVEPKKDSNEVQPRKRGRPRIRKDGEDVKEKAKVDTEEVQPRKRGRPRIKRDEEEVQVEGKKDPGEQPRKRGRPRTKGLNKEQEDELKKDVKEEQPRKRGRLRGSTSSARKQEEPEAEPKKDTTEEQPRKRGRPRGSKKVVQPPRSPSPRRVTPESTDLSSPLRSSRRRSQPPKKFADYQLSTPSSSMARGFSSDEEEEDENDTESDQDDKSPQSKKRRITEEKASSPASKKVISEAANQKDESSTPKRKRGRPLKKHKQAAQTERDAGTCDESQLPKEDAEEESKGGQDDEERDAEFDKIKKLNDTGEGCMEDGDKEKEAELKLKEENQIYKEDIDMKVLVAKRGAAKKCKIKMEDGDEEEASDADSDYNPAESAHHSSQVDPNKFKCHYCPMRFFYTEKDLKFHESCHAEKDGKKCASSFKCPFCTRTGTKWKQISNHLLAHRDKRQELQQYQFLKDFIGPFRCVECKKDFQVRSNLLEHMRTVHSMYVAERGRPKRRSGFTKPPENQEESDIKKSDEVNPTENQSKIEAAEVAESAAAEISDTVPDGDAAVNAEAPDNDEKASVTVCISSEIDIPKVVNNTSDEQCASEEVVEIRPNHENDSDEEWDASQEGNALFERSWVFIKKDNKVRKRKYTPKRKSYIYKCKYCTQRYFDSEDDLNFHESCHLVKDGIVMKEMYYCKYCHVQRDRWHAIMNHILTHKDKFDELAQVGLFNRQIGVFECDQCSKTFVLKSNLMDHKKYAHNSKSAICDICGTFIQASDQKSIRRHIDKCKQIEYKCEFCSYKTMVQHNMMLHNRIHKGKGHICEVCKQVFATKTTMELHKKIHSANRERFVCEHCGQHFLSTMSLQLHIARYHTQHTTLLKCGFCDYTSGLKQDLTQHLEKVHNKKYKCEHCPYQTNSLQSFQTHSDYHLPSKIFGCSYEKCYYRSATEGELQRHVQDVHEATLPHQCVICGKGFRKKAVLSRHIVTHTGIEAYECLECGQKFKTHSSYYRHRRKTKHDANRKGLVSVPSGLTIEVVHEDGEIEIPVGEESAISFVYQSPEETIEDQAAVSNVQEIQLENIKVELVSGIDAVE